MKIVRRFCYIVRNFEYVFFTINNLFFLRFLYENKAIKIESQSQLEHFFLFTLFSVKVFLFHQWS
jgi:hypothetical protein